MKPGLLKPVIFLGKSLLWSALLYTVCMVSLNWDQLSTAARKQQAVAIKTLRTTDHVATGTNVASTLKTIIAEIGKIVWAPAN